MYVETVTTAEAAEVMRTAGISISAETVRNGIEQGVFPFGVCIQGEKRKVYQVYKVLLLGWLKDRASDDCHWE